MEIIYKVSSLWRIGKVRLESRPNAVVRAQFQEAESKVVAVPAEMDAAPSEIKNFNKLGKKVKRDVFPSDISMYLIWKCGSNPFQNYYFLYSKVLKTWFLLISLPWQKNDTFGAKAWKHGLWGEGGRLLLSSPQTVAGAKNVHTKREVW